ncbi:methyltransferase family protein [Oceanospirillum sanctuarii]|uniref:methyltransferase family protein n=1 Tax=Oceanospirillum sanctuarii TaxID=1434821 RepID=UPI000A3C0CC6|nr:isoprenylcysteine carboxylmethyltransferase family protein [Oceanospirillum sanctuarii]
MKWLELKIPPVVVTFLFGFLMWAVTYPVKGTLLILPISPKAAIALTGICLLLGAAFALSGVVSFRLAKTTSNPLDPQKASSLVQSGVYRITRNPMYVGFALLLLAWALFLQSIFAILLVPAFVAYLTVFQIRPEELALHALFPESFPAYCQKVRRWV